MNPEISKKVGKNNRQNVRDYLVRFPKVAYVDPQVLMDYPKLLLLLLFIVLVFIKSFPFNKCLGLMNNLKLHEGIDDVKSLGIPDLVQHHTLKHQHTGREKYIY